MISHHALLTPFPTQLIQPRPTATPTRLIAFARPHDRFGALGLRLARLIRHGGLVHQDMPRNLPRELQYACAADCVSDGSFNYGYITQTKSYFIFTRTYSTTQHIARTLLTVRHITDRYAQTCGYSQQEAAGIVNAGQSTATSSGGKTGAITQPSKSEKLHWYEILVIITASLTVITAAVCTVLIYIWNQSPKYQKQK
jgi:hypothetical protein